MEVEDKDCQEYEISQNILIVKTLHSGFWAIIMALNGEQDVFAAKEYKGIQEMYNKLLPFISPELLHEEYDFSKLDDRAFEKMCRDLLEDFKASGYGLFYSGMLSPQTLDRIKEKESIIYWAKGELEILLRKYKNTTIRYFGI